MLLTPHLICRELPEQPMTRSYPLYSNFDFCFFCGLPQHFGMENLQGRHPVSSGNSNIKRLGIIEPAILKMPQT
jgi:hypothetical protein